MRVNVHYMVHGAAIPFICSLGREGFPHLPEPLSHNGNVCEAPAGGRDQDGTDTSWRKAEEILDAWALLPGSQGSH